MKHTSVSARLPRRQFIKKTSLALGASVFAGRYLIHAGNAGELRGKVISGAGQGAIPLGGVLVSVYEATGGVPRVLGNATTAASGDFSLRARPGTPHAKRTLYATAELGPGLQLVSVLGPTVPRFVTINEMTTVAAGYSMAQFTNDGVISGNEFGLQAAAGMNDNLVAPMSGESSPVLLTSPNADQTNSLRSMRSLANLLAQYVRTNGSDLDRLFTLATPPGENPPGNLLQVLSNIARYPERNVLEVFALSKSVDVYSPSLVTSPDAWTIVVKVNDTGSDEHLFGGPGNLVFDAEGYAWITNNVVQGQPYSGMFNVVLKPNGQPADGRHGTPKSPLLGGGILGAGFGIGRAPNGNVWMGNFGWGGPQYNPLPNGYGSVSAFRPDGKPISGPLGIHAGVDRAQGIATDAEGNIWICSFANDRIYVFAEGDPNRAIHFQEPRGSAPFDIQIASDGTAWVTNSGGLGPDSDSSVAHLQLSQGRIRPLFYKQFGHSLKGLSLDSQDQPWIASGGDDCVYFLSGHDLVPHAFDGGGIDSPWSTAIDGDDNVWVANFGAEGLGVFRAPGVTKLAGSNPETRPPGVVTGHPISPTSGYTLPSAGQEVLLHNGDPLYGPGEPPCYSPLMRVTSVVIDQAGNVWALNNWKPSFANDIVSNPGGDGICIFVGLAKPPAKKAV
jgi:hypothetical protein